MLYFKQLFSLILLLFPLSDSIYHQMSFYDSSDFSSKTIETNISGRDISIYLPPAYHEKAKYKVIYFNDGQHLFKGGWNLEKQLDSLIENKIIEPIVVVGIHSNKNRNNDLIPFSDRWINENWGNYDPKAKEFSNFIKKKIIPFIENNYAVGKESKDRAIAGASLGGLFAMWEGTTHPNYWGTIIAVSPSFWVNDYEIFDYISKRKGITSKIWFDIGATTGEWNYYIPMIEILKRKNLTYSKDFFYYEDSKGYHDASSWTNRIDYPLILFAGTKNFIPIEMQIEIEVIKSSSSSEYFQRINPIISLENEIKFSASTEAKYELINKKDGSIQNDGRFNFKNKNDLEVKVSYRSLSKKVIISFRKVKGQKN